MKLVSLAAVLSTLGLISFRSPSVESRMSAKETGKGDANRAKFSMFLVRCIPDEHRTKITYFRFPFLIGYEWSKLCFGFVFVVISDEVAFERLYS